MGLYFKGSLQKYYIFFGSGSGSTFSQVFIKDSKTLIKIVEAKHLNQKYFFEIVDATGTFLLFNYLSKILKVISEKIV
jgi:hypothetical protein